MQNSFVYKRKINYYETDKMGIVHHSNYIRFMEEARVAYLDSINLGYDKMEEMGVISPVVALSCNYKTPCRFGDEIDVFVEFKEYSGVKFVYEYKITNAKTNDIVFLAKSEHCFTNAEGRPIIIKKQFPELHDIFSKILEK